MSADDCIAILETSVYPGWAAREYRVEHCQAIENVLTYPKLYIKKYFEHSKTFDQLQPAISYAKQLERQAGHVEYGIIIVDNYKQYLWEQLTC